MSDPIAYKPVPRIATPVITAPQAPRGSASAPSPISSTPASTLNKVKKKKDAQQATIAGIGSAIPVIYGRVRMGARIGAVVTRGRDLYLLCVWCIGEIDAVESYTVNDEAPSGSVISATHYTGTQTQVADPDLVAAYAVKGITYNDALPGIAYSVVKVQGGKNSGFPAVAAVIRGRKVALTDGGTPTYSTNPAYCMADFITSSQSYGMGKAVDWTSLAAVADACDALVGTSSEKSRTLSLALDSVQDDKTWLNVLRDYAGCFVVPDGDVYRFVVDEAGDSVKSFTAADIVEKTFKWQKRGLADTPTVVGITYTDTSQTPWADDTVVIYGAGVLEGSAPFRYSGVQKPGIVSYSEANRYGVERLNDATLNDLSISFDAFDEMLALQIGDIIDVTFSAFTAKLFRVTAIAAASPGRWSISAIEYDPAKYSDTVVAGPSVVDTELPDPANPPAVTGVTAASEIQQEEDGYWKSHFRLQWDDAGADFPFVDEYIVTVLQAGAIAQGPVKVPSTSTEFVTGPLKQGLLYTMTVQVLSRSGALGAAGTVSAVSLSKEARPGDVPWITGFEVGGDVALNWGTPVDLDVRFVELRWGAVGVSWESAALLDRVAFPGVRYLSSKVLPAGDLDILAKALDSVRTATFPFGQESLNAARCTVTVTLDTSAFVAADFTFPGATIINMSSIPA